MSQTFRDSASAERCHGFDLGYTHCRQTARKGSNRREDDHHCQECRWVGRCYAEEQAAKHVAELLAGRGLEVDASCVWRWVQAYSPELNKGCRSHLKRTNKKLPCGRNLYKGQGSRQVSISRRRFDWADHRFLLSAKRDTPAAKRFFEKVFRSPANPIPRVINVDKNAAYPAAVDALEADGTLPRRVRLRQCKYLNNVVEQDHRIVKKLTWLAKRYGSFQSAWRTLEGIETMNMIGKGRVRWVAKGNVVSEARFIAMLFAVAAEVASSTSLLNRTHVCLEQTSQRNGLTCDNEFSAQDILFRQYGDYANLPALFGCSSRI
jgi:IS6 family transposase